MKSSFFLISILMAFWAVSDIKAGHSSQNAAAKPDEYPVFFIDSLTVRHWSNSQFLTAASNQNTFEIRTAKHAHEQAGDPKVKAFANMIKTDRETISSKLQALMVKKRYTQPTEVPIELEGKFKYLNGWMGKQFNTRYVSGLIDDSKSDITLYTVFAKKSKDADVRYFAKQALIQLRADQDSAQSMLKYINAPSTSTW